MPSKDDPVRVEHKRFGFWPEIFTLRGRRLHARQLERCWTVARGSGEQRCERRYFRLHCDDGTVVMYHDVRSNLWWLDPALSFRPSPASRFSSAVGRFRRTLTAKPAAQIAPKQSAKPRMARGGC